VTFGSDEVQVAMRRVRAALRVNAAYLTELDQAVGDGDLGVTAGKIADALEAHADEPAGDDLGKDDLGKYLVGGGMAVNRVASSTMGTLLATALMRAGKEVKGKAVLDADDLSTMLTAARVGMQERGKAKLGDKTILDALEPAEATFKEALSGGDTLRSAADKAVRAAQAGLEAVTPLRSRIGRAGWVGERTEGKVDPGCALLIIILEALAGKEKSS